MNSREIILLFSVQKKNLISFDAFTGNQFIAFLSFFLSSNPDYWHRTIKQQRRFDVIMHQKKRILHRVIRLNVWQSPFYCTSWNTSTVWQEQYTVRKQNMELSRHIELGCRFSANTKLSKRQVATRLPPVATGIKYFLSVFAMNVIQGKINYF